MFDFIKLYRRSTSPIIISSDKIHRSVLRLTTRFEILTMKLLNIRHFWHVRGKFNCAEVDLSLTDVCAHSRRHAPVAGAIPIAVISERARASDRADVAAGPSESAKRRGKDRRSTNGRHHGCRRQPRCIARPSRSCHERGQQRSGANHQPEQTPSCARRKPCEDAEGKHTHHPSINCRNLRFTLRLPRRGSPQARHIIINSMATRCHRKAPQNGDRLL